MSDKITYEQFKTICEKWNFDIEEGYKALCFVSSVINQNLSNKSSYVGDIIKNDRYSDEFKKYAKKWKENAVRLSVEYSSVENNIYEMLEKHYEE